MKKVVSALVVLSLTFLCAGLAFSGNADPERELAKSLRRSQKVIEKAQRKLSEGQPIKAEITQLQHEAEGIRASSLLLEERFRVRGQNARELGGKARQRQEEMEVRYHEILGQLQPLLDELARGGPVSSSTLESLQELFKQVIPEKNYPLLGSLPYSHLNYPALEPMVEPLVVPSYRGGNRPAIPADIQGTSEAPITPEIAELAKFLDWNPVRIYEWMQENIETEWYWGSMKGAEETLRQRSGNDADQAALLIAMLRSAGFPARYVRGVIEFHPGIEKAQSLTGLDDPLKIAAFFQKAGIPFEPILAGGKIANFRIEHIWVETEVPYSNYRGALLDNMGKIWIALDTQMKPAGYQWSAPEDFGADFNLAALPEEYLSQVRTEAPLEYLRSAFDKYLGGNFSAATYQDHLRTRIPVFEPLGILPASLQFHSTSITGEYIELPVELRHQVTFAAATTDGSEIFTVTFDAASLSNRSVSLSYEPETVEDQQIIHSYGGLDNTPSYLVRLRPVLRVDNERQVVGRDGLPMGADYILTIGLTSPNERHEVVSHHVIGNLSSLGIVSQKVVHPTELPLEEKDAERLLHEAALSYAERWNAAEEDLAAFLKVVIARPLPTVVTVGGVIDVADLFDVPHGFDWKGVFIDAGFRRIETVAAPGQEERAREFMRLSALEGSILENRIFEDDFGVASISTAKLMALAPERLIIDGSNVDALLPTLELSENVEADILNAVHQGLSITLPEAELSYRNWTGIGYIKENPATGEAGYMLSGMIAGGMTAEEWADQILRERFENAYSEPPNQDPGAAARIIMIPVGDRQNGTVGQEVEEPLAVLVVDLEGRPVVGAEVTFTSLAGGANFDGAANMQVTTGGNGIAKVSPTLGTMTKDNPSYLRTSQGDAYLTQVGVNLFSATVSGQYGTLSLPKPFEVYGQPDVPVGMAKVVGDENWSMANNSAGTIKVLVADQYQNPVSNVPVTFKTESASSMSSVTTLPPNYRSVTFYDSNECTNEYPLYGECSSSASITKKSAHFGVGVNAILGNTVNTRYEVSANTPGVPGETFTLYSGGYWEEDAYLPPQLFVRHLTQINDQGEEVNAAKAGEQLKTPLVATMIIMTSDYTMEGPETCTKYDSKGQSYQTDCWTIKGTGLAKTERINDGTVQFTPVSGGGSVASVENLGDGSYQTTYTTGSIPSLNQVEAVGEATVTVPQVYSTYYGIPIETGYTVDSLPLRTVTLKSGQRGLFSQATKELLSQSEQKIGYEAYGVDVKTEVSPKVLFLGEENMARDDLTVTYSILPDGEPPAGYAALSAQVDLSSVGLSGGTKWEGYLVGSSVKGTGTAIFSYGKEFDLQKNYYVQPVLNRGGEIEIRGDKVALKIVSVDLDLDSDNNAGFKPDSTHNDPQRGPMEDQVEDHAGAPGKLIRPNLLDVDGDKVPGFADGIDMYGNEADGASAPFVPLIMELGGLALDPATTTVRFDYPGSDPAQVQQVTADDGTISYIPAPGSLRLWTRDGGKSRKVADLAAGGDYVTPGKSYTLAQLSATALNGIWRFYVEAVRNGAGVGSERISLHIDVDGPGPLPELEGDAVRTTSLLAALVPDYNHDRVIDEKDIERAERGDTYYFWINDDDDEGETGGSDIPGDGDADSGNVQIDGVRDLVDFCPVYLDVKELIDLFDPAAYRYILSHGAEGVNVALSGLKPEEAGKYLIDVPTAREQVTKQALLVRGAGLDLTGPLPSSNPYGRPTPDLSFLLSIRDEGKGVLLLEGVKESKAPLTLTIYDKSDSPVFSSSLDLSLDGVENMFRHLNLIPAVANRDGENMQSEHGSKGRGEPDRFLRHDEQPDNFPDNECGESYLVMLHGFKVDGQEARGWHTEMFKRLYWSGSRARFVGVSWYGFENLPDYHQNVVNAFETAAVLGARLKPVVGDSPVSLMAHSLGNMVVSSYLEDYHEQLFPEQAPNIAKYFMLNAAVSLEAYLGDYQGYAEGKGTELISSDNPMVHPIWYDYQKRLGSSEWHQLFNGTDDSRHNLTWRERFANIDRRGVNVYSFYSRGEDVLGTHAGDPGLFDAVRYVILQEGRYSWAYQEKWKGRAPYDGYGGTTLMGWAFNSGYYVLSDKAAANSISDDQLKTIPFFRKPQAGELGGGLFENIVSTEYVNQHRDELLAKALPSLTLPTGGLEGGDMTRDEFLDYVFDMNGEDFRDNLLWPEARGEDKNWKHSDIKKIAHIFNHKVFEKIIILER